MRRDPFSKHTSKNFVNKIKAGNGSPVVEVIFFSPFINQFNNARVDRNGETSKTFGFFPNQKEIRAQKFSKSFIKLIRKFIWARILFVS